MHSCFIGWNVSTEYLAIGRTCLTSSLPFKTVYRLLSSASRTRCGVAWGSTPKPTILDMPCESCCDGRCHVAKAVDTTGHQNHGHQGSQNDVHLQGALGVSRDDFAVSMPRTAVLVDQMHVVHLVRCPSESCWRFKPAMPVGA